MKDCFSYHGEGVLPIYSPGIPAYGQKGAPGNTGEKGSSVYFSAYVLSDDNEKAEAISCILQGKQLSNNSRYTEDSSVEYKGGDTILDLEGKIYKIKEWYEKIKDSVPVEYERHIDIEVNTNINMYSQAFPEVTNFSAACITTFQVNYTWDTDVDISQILDGEDIEYVEEELEYSWKISNPSCVSSNPKSYEVLNKSYLKDYYNEYLYGNHIKFDLSIDAADKNYNYIFYLELPNGETMSVRSTSPSATMFVENKLFYSCYDFHSYKMDLNTAVIEFDNMPKGAGSYSQTIDEILAIPDSSLSPEDKYKILTLLTSNYIHDNCNAYVEILDLDFNTTYRYDIDDVYFDKNTAILNRKPTGVNDSSVYRESAVSPTEVRSGWEEVVYTLRNSSINDLDPERVQIVATDNNPDTSYLIFKTGATYEDTFEQFDKYCYRKSNTPCVIAADYVKYDVGFMPSAPAGTSEGQNKGENFYNIGSNTFIYDGITPVGENYIYVWESPNTADTGYAANRILRLNFTNVSNIVLLLKYNKTENDEYPASIIYVGHPNVPLLNFQKPNGDDVQAGIYYMNKIVPYSYIDEADSNTISAGSGWAQVNINVASFSSIKDPNSKNFVDIGVVSKDNSPSAHSAFDPTNEAAGKGDITLLLYKRNDTSLPGKIIDDTPSEQTKLDGDYIEAPKLK